MLILLDECLPQRLRRLFAGHDARTAGFMGWCGVRNGTLLALMAEHSFQALLTTDRNLRFQQNLSSAGVAVLVLVAPTNAFEDLAPLMPKVLDALANLQPGDAVEVAADPTIQ
jgi:hypothetical protein